MPGFHCYYLYVYIVLCAEAERQNEMISKLSTEMEDYRRQQQELDEQRQRAEELRRQFEESAHVAQEEKERLVSHCSNRTHNLGCFN